MNRFFLFALLLMIIASCSNNNKTEPYSDILSLPPYAGLTDSIKLQPNNDDLFFRRAVLLNTNNYPEPALADFRKAWSINKQEPYALGIATLLLDKKPDSAISFITQALKEIPSQLLKLSLAHAYDKQGKTDEALVICNEILYQDPLRVDVIKLKADLLDRKGETLQAIALLEKVYQLIPSDVELNYELASKYAETKNPKVLRLCDSLLRADNDTMNLHAEPAYFKGVYYSNINEKDKAISQFNEAITRNYYYLNAYIEKGRALLDKKKTTEAQSTFNLVLTISPKFPDAYYWIGRCQEIMGKKDEAKLNYQRAFSLDPTFTEAKDAAEKIK